MITISKELLTEAGYDCWSQNPPQEPHICRKWQKCVYNEDGTKRYFINIDETFGWNPPSQESSNNFWPAIGFKVEVPNFEPQYLNIELVQWFNESGKYSGITIPVMEQMIETFFTQLNGKDYDN